MFDLFKPVLKITGGKTSASWPDRIDWEAPAAKDYRASKSLARAVNVAIELGKPLLVTGEPGTGKTQLAHAVAHQLSQPEGLHFDDRILRFDTKSTSTANDLFYSYDLLGRYASSREEGQGREQNSNGKSDPREKFLTINAMGTAILWTWGEEHALSARIDKQLQREEPCRAVVLIDEIDKAPRDFPNDLLMEIERFEFSISELDLHVECKKKDWRPVVIITSNSEKNLPDAFLRRCVYFHIEFPNEDDLAAIVGTRLRNVIAPDDELNLTASVYFYQLRKLRPSLDKKPGTAEYLNWIAILAGQSGKGKSLFVAKNLELIQDTLGALVKTREDVNRARAHLGRFLDRDESNTD